MGSNILIQNVKKYYSSSHRFINTGSGKSSLPISNYVTLPKYTVLTIENCNVGIGTTIPRELLDIQGGNAIISGNVGVGTTSALYAVDVVGDVNFTGILRQSGTPYVSSQWTTAGANIYYSTGNVGVGTTAPLYTIDAAGDINFTGTLYQNGTPFSSGSSQWTTSGANIYYSTGNVGIGTNDPLNYSLNVNGDSYLKKVITSNLVILQEPTSYFQITPVRKVYYIETASESIFNVNVVGIYGGVASNVQCFVNNDLLSYYSSNIKDYDISYTHTTASNLTTYTITLTVPAVYGSIVDITVTPQIITETDLSNNLFYQNVYVTDTYFRPYGNNIAYTNGNVGIGTTDPLQSFHVQNQSYFVGNVGIGTTVPLKLLDIRDDAIVSGRIGIGTTNPLQSLHVQNQSYFVGNVGLGTTVPLKLLDIRDDAIVSGRIGIGTTNPLQSLHVQNESYFVGNVGIGTTNPDVRLLVGENSTRNEVIKVNSQGYAGLILNGDTANTAGEAGGAYVTMRVDGAITACSIALTQVAGEDGKGGSLTNSTANSMVIYHSDNYPIHFGTNNSVKMTLSAAGELGIGSTNPPAILSVYGSSGTAITGEKQIYIAHHTTGNYGWYLGNQTATPSTTDLDFYFAVNRNGTLTEPAYIQDNTALTQMNFTGQHKCFLKDMSSNEILQYSGLIVSANQNKYIRMSNGIAIGKDAITITESLPIVTITTTSNDKSVMGVISDVEDAERRKEEYGAFVTLFKKEKGDTRAYINSLGEGAIWVSDINGSLESGDYITSSTIPGYGMKQNDDLLHNYTVAKITMNCDFNPATLPKYQVKKDPITQENILDSKGNLQWEEVIDDNGNIIYEKEYDIRYLLLDGTQITEAQYNDALNNQISVYKAAFVGCTYHCG